MIPVTSSFNYSFINPHQLSSDSQQSSIYSHNRTHELQASSIPGWTSPDISNTTPPLSTNNGSHNIYGYMVYVSKMTPEQKQHQHAVMLLKYYHDLWNTNYPSSMFVFVSPPPIPNIESLSQPTIS